MKKVSISLIAVLAIVLATASAFTTSMPGTDRWFLIDEPMVYDTYDNSGVFNSLGTYVTTAVSDPEAAGGCDNAELDLVCAVKIFDANDDVTLQSGELPGSAPSSNPQAGFIIYKEDVTRP